MIVKAGLAGLLLAGAGALGYYNFAGGGTSSEMDLARDCRPVVTIALTSIALEANEVPKSDAEEQLSDLATSSTSEEFLNEIIAGYGTNIPPYESDFEKQLMQGIAKMFSSDEAIQNLTAECEKDGFAEFSKELNDSVSEFNKSMEELNSSN